MELLTKLPEAIAARVPNLSPRSWMLNAVFVLIIVAGILLLVFHRSGTSQVPLFEGQTFSSHELARMVGALHAAGLEQGLIRDQQVFVPVTEKDKYLSALISADAFPSDFDDALSQAMLSDNPFLSGEQLRSRQRYGEFKKLERIIAGMAGIEAASVQCTEVKQSGFPPIIERQALVAVRAAGRSHVDFGKIEAIRDSAAGYLGLDRQDVTVSDLNACRTYSGTTAANNPLAATYALVAAAEALESEYQAKIEKRLAGYPGVVISANVQSVESRSPETESTDSHVFLSQPLVTASIDVPQSYLNRVLESRRAGDRDLPPDNEAMVQLQQEVFHSIETAVIPLLPPPPARASTIRQVTVTSYADLPAEISPQPGRWTLPFSLASLAIICTALICVVGSVVYLRGSRHRRGDSALAPSGLVEQPLSEPVPTPDVPAASPADASPHQETHDQLTEAVRQDPDAAAEILKKWLGRAA